MPSKKIPRRPTKFAILKGTKKLQAITGAARRGHTGNPLIRAAAKGAKDAKGALTLAIKDVVEDFLEERIFKELQAVKGLSARSVREEASEFTQGIARRVCEKVQQALDETEAVVKYEEELPFRTALDKAILEAEGLLERAGEDTALEAEIVLAKKQAELSSEKNFSK